MQNKVVVLIDGGYLREVAREFRYNPDFIEKISSSVVADDEVLQRVLYYDCDPFSGDVKLPVSGKTKHFEGRGWLDILAAKELFAVRKGVLKFRGFKPRHVPVSGKELSDNDFKPDFEQKGVDMRIGLDIATFSISGKIDRIILISGDTDCVPAMKFGRISGLQIVLIKFPKQKLARELLWHTDYCRSVSWPRDVEKFEKKQ